MKNKKEIYAVWGKALLAGALVLMAFISGRTAQSGNTVTICHLPPGNPSNVQTITISVNALPAHLAHGDAIGQCINPGGDTLTTVVDPNH